VGAGFGVDAFVGEAEALDRTPGDKVLVDDGFGVFGLHVAVPHGIGVDDDRGTVLALIQAKRLVDADIGSEAGFSSELRKAGVQFALSIGGAGRARGAGGADVMTDEDVTFKRGQAGILLIQGYGTGTGDNFPHSGLAWPVASARMGV
jgi:hypothetical protein